MSHTDLASVQCGKYAHYASVSLFGIQSSIDSDRVHIAKKLFTFNIKTYFHKLTVVLLSGTLVPRILKT